MPLDDVLRYGRDLADALANAHDQGIVHRDLKPANIVITAGAVLKIPDLGLAKQRRAGKCEQKNLARSSLFSCLALLSRLV